jgi:hypothetical protein
MPGRLHHQPIKSTRVCWHSGSYRSTNHGSSYFHPNDSAYFYGTDGHAFCSTDCDTNEFGTNHLSNTHAD